MEGSGFHRVGILGVASRSVPCGRHASCGISPSCPAFWAISTTQCEVNPCIAPRGSGSRMLGQWLSRLRSARPGNKLPAEPAPASRQSVHSTAAANVATATPHGSWLIARRPLIDRSGGITGWDLQLSARASERLARRDTPRVLREAYRFALAQAARETADAARRVLVGLPVDALADSAFLDQLPARTIVRVSEDQMRDLAAM